MINVETIRFIDMLNDLARKTTKGFVPFSKYTGQEEYENCVIYDDHSYIKDVGYRIPQNMCVFPEHHDIIGYYDGSSWQGRVQIGAMIDEDCEYILVRFNDDDDSLITIMDSSNNQNSFTRYGGRCPPFFR